MHLAELALAALSCRSMDGELILLHFQLTSYVASIPNCEDMILWKRETPCLSRRPSFLKSTDYFYDNKMYLRRVERETTKLLSEMRADSVVANCRLLEFSKLEVPPGLHKFRLAWIDSSANIDQLHCFLLGLLRLLTQSLFHYLPNTDNTLNHCRMWTGSQSRSSQNKIWSERPEQTILKNTQQRE